MLPQTPAAVKGLGPPGGGVERRMGGEKGGKGKGGERGGPQFKKNDPPSSDGWLRACSQPHKTVNDCKVSICDIWKTDSEQYFRVLALLVMLTVLAFVVSNHWKQAKHQEWNLKKNHFFHKNGATVKP